MSTYEAIVKVLSVIENRKFDMLTIDDLAREAYLSPSHLQRVFRLICGQSLMHYARGRKLAYSLDELLSTNMGVIDIAAHYGFRHEQSYIRAFYKEYGCTPGESRASGEILPIRARINAEDLTDLSRGILTVPKMARVPAMRLVGKPYTFHGFNTDSDALITNRAGVVFITEAQYRVPGMINPEVYYGVCRQFNGGPPDLTYMPCVRAKSKTKAPEGYEALFVPPMLCACFHYVGNHKCEDISMITAREIYNARVDFFNKQTRYLDCCTLPGGGDIRHIERIDTRLYDGVYCQMDLLVPVRDSF